MIVQDWQIGLVAVLVVTPLLLCLALLLKRLGLVDAEQTPPDHRQPPATTDQSTD